MAAAWLDGTGLLWHVLFKINGRKGYNFKFHVPNVDEPTCRTVATRIALRIKALLPTTCAIHYATMTKDDTDQDSRRIPEAFGAGTAGASWTVPFVNSKPDNSSSCILTRFEHSAGGGVNMKIAPIPDTVVEDDELVVPIPSIIGVPAGVLPLPGVGVSFALEFAAFMGDMIQSAKAVKSGHLPGGPFKYANFLNAHVTGIRVKKGGRVFI